MLTKLAGEVALLQRIEVGFAHDAFAELAGIAMPVAVRFTPAVIFYVGHTDAGARQAVLNRPVLSAFDGGVSDVEA